MSIEAEGHHKGKYDWNSGIPPLDPVDPRHSVSLLMIAEARSGYEASKRIIDERFTPPKKKETKYSITWDDTGESIISLKEIFDAR